MITTTDFNRIVEKIGIFDSNLSSPDFDFNRNDEKIGIFDANDKIQQNNCNNEDKIRNQNIKYIESRFQHKTIMYSSIVS